METVRTVNGRLVFEGIKSSGPSTCLTNLAKINHTARGGAAIEVRRNDGLVTLGLSSISEIHNRDTVVFRVINDQYLEKTSEPELEHLIKAAGGDPNHCLNLFYVWSGGSGKFSSESVSSSYVIFFAIYGGVSLVVYGAILCAHFVFKVHLPPQARRSRTSMKSFRTLRSLKSGREQASYSASLPDIHRAAEPSGSVA